MLTNLGSIYRLKQQFEKSNQTQIQDLDLVTEAATLSSDMAAIQNRISNTLESANSGALDEALIYSYHSEFVESFALLETRVLALEKSAGTFNIAREDTRALVKHFNNYRNFVIMAGDIAAIDPARANEYISDARAHFVAFAKHSNQIAATLSQQVRNSGLNDLSVFETVFYRILVIVLLGLLLIIFLSSITAKRLANRMSIISQALSSLSNEHNIPPELPEIIKMEKKEHGEFHNIAHSVLSFRQAILDRNNIN